ncbi:hypothetical protein BDN71DRAFT_1048429 [Pleurotus eryngii]|uniref:Uncharacterized protein n=1 Tax=Pleurotus eryngii TaxID=5323 RepID=A0A9P6DKJ2_PLEER|nr:hypothetical protein BDN71DRAFT_1048429 [Pleurotus eryngii]
MARTGDTCSVYASPLRTTWVRTPLVIYFLFPVLWSRFYFLFPSFSLFSCFPLHIIRKQFPSSKGRFCYLSPLSRTRWQCAEDAQRNAQCSIFIVKRLLILIASDIDLIEYLLLLADDLLAIV